MSEVVEEQPTTLTPEVLAQRFPTTYRPLGRFKDRPNYFRRKGKDKPIGAITKQLERKGLPVSWAGKLRKLDLKPSVLKQRIRELAELRNQIQLLLSRNP
jgi:hypothetical protein